MFEQHIKLKDFRERQDIEEYEVWDEEKQSWINYDTSCYNLTEFPDPTKASQEINVITIWDSLENKFYTWGCEQYTTTELDIVYTKCKDEKDMILKLIEYFEKDYPDILAGWASETFDIPYILNRCTNILGEETTKRLSPSGRVYSRLIHGAYGQERIRWYIEGISLLDYLDVYKRFCLGVRESYKLNAIAQHEIGEAKVDYGAINLATLAQTDWNKFVNYNIQDVRLLVKLDNKLKYIDLTIMLAYSGLTTFEAAMGTISVVMGAATVRARFRNQKLITYIRDDIESKNPGAYVAEPLRGFQECIVSFDASSLYPSVMISLNMSPETKVGNIKFENDKVILKHVNGKRYDLTKENFQKFIIKEQVAVSKANVLFSQKKVGLIPEILILYYSRRQEIRKNLSKLQKQLNNFVDKKTDEAKQIKLQINQLDTKQLCIKLYINSVYGIFGNKNAPIGDDDIASSITLTGQSVVKHTRDLFKQYLRDNVSGISEENADKCVIYSDTDSAYLSLKPLFNETNKFKENGKLTKYTYDQVQRVGDFLNKEIKVWGEKEFNSKDCRFVFKQEVIADVGIFLEKKRYVLHLLDKEGIPTDKFKYTGVQVVRSTMPASVKPYVKKIIETMLLTQDISKTNAVVNETYETFKKLSVEEITFVSGLNKFEEKVDECDDFKTAKGMPKHAKAAYMYNLMLDKLGIANKYEKIGSGDKVRYFDVKMPNKYNIPVIAYKYYYPEEFKNVFEPDYESMFDGHIFSVVEGFYENVNWSAQKPGLLVQSNIFDLFS